MITIQKRPYEYNFTGNPIVYELLDNDAIADATLAFQVKGFFMRLDGSVFEELPIITIAPYQGRAKIDISSLLNIKLQHYLPPVDDTSTSYGSGSASLKFYIHFRTISNTVTNPAWITTEEGFIRWGFKGGIQQFRNHGNPFFTQYVPNAKPFYTWQVRNRLAAVNERIYLNWLNLLYGYFPDAAFLKLKVMVEYNDTTTTTVEFSVIGLYKGFRYYIPAGATELGLPALNPAKNIWLWQCWLEDTSSGGLGIITEKFTFVLDNRNDYNNLPLFYRNSIGGLDTVRLRGVITKTLDYQASTTQRSAEADYQDADTLPAILRTESAIETMRYKADLGWLGKDEQDRLRDALLNREAYILKNGRWMPLNFIQGGFELTRTDAFKWSVPIEFTIADDGINYYTPESIDLGDAEALTNTCASSIIITGFVLHPNSPSPGMTRTTFSWAVSGAGIGLQWRVPGFVDDWQDIAYASSGTTDYAVSSDVQFNFQMRVKCSEGNFGAQTSRFVDTNPAPPTSNSTIYNNTDTTTTWILKVNGTEVATGTVAAGGYQGFYLAPVVLAGDFELILGSVAPGTADLYNNVDTTYSGAISGSTVDWLAITSTSLGITITID